MTTYTDQLKKQLDRIKQLMFDLIDNSRIKYSGHNSSGGVVIIAPNYYWDQPTEKEQQIQIKLKELYGKWMESFRFLTHNSPDSLKREIQKVDRFMEYWIEKRSDWSIPSTLIEAKKRFETEIEFYYETLTLFSNSGDKETILIPDTNALLTDPNPKNYTAIAETDKFTMIILPTVLSELDELKMKSSNQDFQNKVKSVITRLKGYRQQGNLTEGVTVDKTITIKMVASEPNFSETLSWLDKENNDDRIIASVLEIQRSNPSSRLCIVTGDINLQNKAEMASFPYKDI